MDKIRILISESLLEEKDSNLQDKGSEFLKGRSEDFGKSPRDSLILRENESTYYIHCFTHQLQLALVAVVKKHLDISWFFNSVTNIFNIVGGSCK